MKKLLIIAILSAWIIGCDEIDDDDCVKNVTGCDSDKYSCPAADNCYETKHGCSASGEC